jgi:MSHA biogenesis protein MshI
MKRWPWQRPAAQRGTLACTVDGDTLAWVHAEGTPGRPGRVLAAGSGSLAPEGGASPLRGRPAATLIAVVPLHASQLLQVEAPAVPPEELRAAARWRIKDLVEGALDDYTIDVMPVGSGSARGAKALFVAAARNTVLRRTTEWAQGADLPLAVVDVAETTQRNLQTAAAAAEGLAGRATAALLRHGAQCLLTLCVDGELYEARRLSAELLDDAAAGHGSSGSPLADDPAAPLPADWDYVDYGAVPEADAPVQTHERLLGELQRSFDVWERSHPAQPLAALWLATGAGTDALCQALAPALGLRVLPLQPESLLPGLAAAAPDAELQTALLPLLGALLRDDRPTA